MPCYLTVPRIRTWNQSQGTKSEYFSSATMRIQIYECDIWLVKTVSILLQKVDKINKQTELVCNLHSGFSYHIPCECCLILCWSPLDRDYYGTGHLDNFQVHWLYWTGLLASTNPCKPITTIHYMTSNCQISWKHACISLSTLCLHYTWTFAFTI